jgi:hypothetical protein
MNLFRSEDHARRWPQFNPKSEVGFISLSDLAAFFATESRHHMLDDDYLSVWYPKRATERRTVLERIGKTVPFWMGTPDPQ